MPSGACGRASAARSASCDGELRRGRQAQFDPEHAAHADRAFRADGAAHQLDQPLGHHQADARAFLGAGLLAEPIERLEQLRKLLRRQSRAGVPHADANRIRRLSDALDGDRAARPVVLDGVEQQVDQDLLDPGPVGLDEVGDVEARKGHADAALLRLRLDHGPAFEHDLGQRDRLAATASPCPTRSARDRGSR